MDSVLRLLEKTPFEGSVIESAESLRQARGKLKIKPLIASAVLWAALAVLLVVGSANLSALRKYPSVSLRYNTPVSGQAAYRARQYAIEHGGEESFWPVFWHETGASFSCGYNKSTATCIIYSGDAALVWPAQYQAGAAPGVTDGAGCAISSALAWELWGGVDVVGRTVDIDEETRIVRGVFEGEDLLALLSVRDEDTGRSFTAVELTGGPSAPARSDVESFIAASGLGKPDYILMGTPVLFASIMAVLPLIMLAAYGLALCIGQLKQYPNAMWGGLFLLMIGFALFLPRLLETLPGWMTPSRWSDFSFWGSLSKQIGNDLREYFILAPRLRDVTYKILLLKQAGIAFLSVCLAMSVCHRWNRKMQG